MKKVVNYRMLLPTMLLVMLLCLNGQIVFAADDTFSFKFDYDSRSVVDSTRRDYYEHVYDPAVILPAYEKRQYDKTFIGGRTDMMFQISGDLNETHFLDIKENLYYRHFNNRELLSRSYDSFKYRELDHMLNVTWGIAAGDHDYFQFDFFNTILKLPDIESLEFSSNKGSALMSHEFSQRTALTLKADYEERQYDNDQDYNFREAGAGFEVASLIFGKYRYTQVANSSRGERKYFEGFPSAMSAKKAIDHYTSYVTSPHDDDPGAKYKRKRSRGDLFLKVFADMGARDFTRVGNKYNQFNTGFELAYEIADDMTLRLRDTYRKVDFSRESAAYFHHDFSSNLLVLSAEYDYSSDFFQVISFSDELQNHQAAAQHNFRVNAIDYEGFYTFGRSRASLGLRGLRRRFDQSRIDYADEDEYSVLFGYDYLITETLRFRLKSEFLKREFLDFDNDLFSDHNRNSYRMAIEKSLSRYNSLEIAFQQNSEKHQDFFHNNLEEKSLHLSWISHY